MSVVAVGLPVACRCFTQDSLYTHTRVHFCNTPLSERACCHEWRRYYYFLSTLLTTSFLLLTISVTVNMT